MTVQEQVDQIVEKYLPHAKTWDCYHDVPDEENHSTRCAILEVEACVKLLNKLRKGTYASREIIIEAEINKAILTELKSRIK